MVYPNVDIMIHFKVSKTTLFYVLFVGYFLLQDSLENKENERTRRRRDIPTDKHPVLVMKHRGRFLCPCGYMEGVP